MTTTTTIEIPHHPDCDLCERTVHDEAPLLFICRPHYQKLTARIAELESGIHLPGWWCLSIRESGCRCDTFNGESKEKHAFCRNCDRPRPTPQ
jgi:hypothetical protein